jgi:hypothetical protein
MDSKRAACPTATRAVAVALMMAVAAVPALWPAAAAAQISQQWATSFPAGFTPADAVVDPDGSLLVLGTTTAGATNNVTLLKIDATGILIYSRTLVNTAPPVPAGASNGVGYPSVTPGSPIVGAASTSDPATPSLVTKSIALDDAGNVYVGGSLATSVGAAGGAFYIVGAFDRNGNQLWGSYLLTPPDGLNPIGPPVLFSRIAGTAPVSLTYVPSPDPRIDPQVVISGEFGVGGVSAVTGEPVWVINSPTVGFGGLVVNGPDGTGTVAVVGTRGSGNGDQATQYIATLVDALGLIAGPGVQFWTSFVNAGTGTLGSQTVLDPSSLPTTFPGSTTGINTNVVNNYFAPAGARAARFANTAEAPKLIVSGEDLFLLPRPPYPTVSTPSRNFFGTRTVGLDVISGVELFNNYFPFYLSNPELRSNDYGVADPQGLLIPDLISRPTPLIPTDRSLRFAAAEIDNFGNSYVLSYDANASPNPDGPNAANFYLVGYDPNGQQVRSRKVPFVGRVNAGASGGISFDLLGNVYASFGTTDSSGNNPTNTIVSYDPGGKELFRFAVPGGGAKPIVGLFGEVFVVTPSGAASYANQAAGTVYRLFLDATDEHFLTTDVNEYAILPSVGWIQEGRAFRLVTSPFRVTGVTATPLYRLFNPQLLLHLYTSSLSEYQQLPGKGWVAEGSIGYLFPTQVVGTIPLLRLYSPGAKAHLLTTDANEYNILGLNGAWTQEGIVGWVLP